MTARAGFGLAQGHDYGARATLKSATATTACLRRRTIVAGRSLSTKPGSKKRAGLTDLFITIGMPLGRLWRRAEYGVGKLVKTLRCHCLDLRGSHDNADIQTHRHLDDDVRRLVEIVEVERGKTEQHQPPQSIAPLGPPASVRSTVCTGLPDVSLCVIVS